MKNLFPIALVLLVAIVGCKLPGSSSSNAGNSGTSNNGAPNSPGAAEADPLASVTNALKKLRDAPFVTSTFARADSSQVVEQYSAQDKSYSRSPSNDEETKVIIIGNESFSKMNSFWPWSIDKGSTDSAADMFFSRLANLERILPEFDAKSEGTETVEGQAAEVFSFRLTEKEPDVPSSFKIWVAKETGLPLKIVSEPDDGSGNEETFDYKTPVKIERPVVGKK